MSAPWYDSDQRYFPRWDVKNRVLYKLEKDQQPHEGYTKDLHCAGLCLRVDDQLRPKQKLKLTVHLANETTIQAEGTVMWIKDLGDHREAGISFSQLSDLAKNLIFEYAFQVRKKDVIRQWFKGWEH